MSVAIKSLVRRGLHGLTRQPYRITYSGPAFGDNLFSAFITAVLNDNGIPAVLHNPRIAHLADCPLDESPEDTLLTFNCVRCNRPGKETAGRFTVYTDLLQQFRVFAGLRDTIPVTRNFIPVKYFDIPQTPAVDVAMVTRSGHWTPYRNWPYFAGLKAALSSAGISFIDLSEQSINDIPFLNYVKKAKIFLGLETGASHYASRFANGKALILQSGYCDFEYWAGDYRYERLEAAVHCRPCWLREGCRWEHACMENLTVDRVFRELTRRLQS